jgi:hypothetical protein
MQVLFPFFCPRVGTSIPRTAAQTAGILESGTIYRHAG